MFMGRVVDVSSTWGVRIEPLPPPPAWISYAYGTDLDPCSLETSWGAEGWGMKAYG
jgi:hypothetical protein